MHQSISVSVKNTLGEGLAKWGITRDIGMTISGHLAMPVIIAHSDLIATVTQELAEPYVENTGFRCWFCLLTSPISK